MRAGAVLGACIKTAANNSVTANVMVTTLSAGVYDLQFIDMQPDSYNYSVFEVSSTEFLDFATHAPKVTMRAPSFPLEDLASGTIVEMKELWKDGVAIVEFGSFT